MAGALPREIQLILQRIHGRLVSRPARDVALWLACVPFVLPAPLIAGVIALSKRMKGERDPRWRIVLAISCANFVLSAVLLAVLYSILGDWIILRLNELLGPLFFWPYDPEPRAIQV